MPLLIFEYRDETPTSFPFFCEENFSFLRMKFTLWINKNAELSEWSPGAEMGVAHRAFGHACGTANVTEMSKTTKTCLTLQGAQGILFYAFSKDLGQATNLVGLERSIQVRDDVLLMSYMLIENQFEVAAGAADNSLKTEGMAKESPPRTGSCSFTIIWCIICLCMTDTSGFFYFVSGTCCHFLRTLMLQSNKSSGFNIVYLEK